jgi:hypothetical protein
VKQITTVAGNKEIVQVGKKIAVSKNAIEGLVLPNKWDDNGQIIGIAIHADKEEIYLVAQNRMEGQLLNQLHLRVRIEGQIMERLDGSKLIHVASVKPIVSISNDKQSMQKVYRK